MLGRPARLRKEEISPRFTRYHRLVILVVMLIGIAGAFVPHGPSVPYLRTAIGAVLGIGLIVFGRRVQRTLLAAARPDARDGMDRMNGVNSVNGMNGSHGTE